MQAGGSGFLSNTGQDPLQNHKLYQASSKVWPSSAVGADDGPLLVLFGSSLLPYSAKNVTIVRPLLKHALHFILFSDYEFERLYENKKQAYLLLIKDKE